MNLGVASSSYITRRVGGTNKHGLELLIVVLFENDGETWGSFQVLNWQLIVIPSLCEASIAMHAQTVCSLIIMLRHTRTCCCIIHKHTAAQNWLLATAVHPIVLQVTIDNMNRRAAQW